MKRAPLTRKTPLRKGGSQLARTPLRRVASLVGRKHRPKPWASSQTLELVMLRSGGCCECGCGREVPVGLSRIWFHHVFPKAQWPELVDTPDNIIHVTAECHARHENAYKRFARFAVRRAERLATTPQMKRYLDTHYERRALP